MRKTDRYTVPFPAAELPASTVYRDRFREFPFWYRWYLRLLAIVNGLSIEQIVRRQDLFDLKRRLATIAEDQVDSSIPALLPGFLARLRIIDANRRRISGALEEISGNGRGAFLSETIARVDPEIHHTLTDAAAVPETLLESTETPLAVAREAVRTHLAEELEQHLVAIETHLGPLWRSVQALNVLRRYDMSPLFPPTEAAGLVRVPLRPVRVTLQELYQVLDLVRRNTNRTATEIAWEYVRHKARLNPGPPGAIWSAVEEFLHAAPLLEIVRVAWDEPYLEIKAVTVRSEWWESFRQARMNAALERVGSQLLARRIDQVRELLSREFLIDRDPPGWLPSELYPASLGNTLLLAGSEFFHDTRRVVTQLVIDGVFHHLDTRNALHHAALRIDQSLNRLTALLGNGEHRGTLGEELQRIRSRSGSSAIIRRRLVGLYERHRLRIRTSLEELMDALETGGTLVDRTLSGTEVGFEYARLKSQSFSGDYSAMDLLSVVGNNWLPLGRALRGLYRIENGI